MEAQLLQAIADDEDAKVLAANPGTPVQANKSKKRKEQRMRHRRRRSLSRGGESDDASDRCHLEQDQSDAIRDSVSSISANLAKAPSSRGSSVDSDEEDGSEGAHPAHDEVAVPMHPVTIKCDNRENKVLIVDDTVVNLTALSLMLSRLGIKSSMAQSGHAALELICERRAEGAPMYKLVFMDMQMPSMDGVETSERIRRMLEQPRNAKKRRRDKANRRPYICGITAVTRSNIKRLAKEAGADDLIIKPLEKWQLRNILEDAHIL